MKFKLSKLLFVFLCIFLCNKNAIAQQASLETFGQNRVQTKLYEWQYYDSTNFRIFFYSYGKFNAQYVLQQAEADLKQIVNTMGARLSGKINIVLYNSYSDYKQTNIGRNKEELNKSQGGKLDISDPSIVLYFDGTHDGLRKQTRKGITKMLKDNILFGYGIKDIVKNAIKMNLPPWFTQGYVEHIATGWTADNNASLISLLQAMPKKKFDDLALDNPQLLGQSFWNYIANNYPPKAEADLLYLAKNRTAINDCIKMALGNNYKEVFVNWKKYYNKNIDSTNMDSVAARQYLATLKPSRNGILKSFAISPNGVDIAYCEIKDGQYTINLFNTKSKKNVQIVEGGIRSNLETKDPTYPILCYSGDGRKLAIMYERDYKQRLKIYDGKKGKTTERVLTENKMDRITGMSFMDDDDKLVISAIKKGQSDLYQFIIKNARLLNITKDIWDDVSPMYINTGERRGILFLSNRPYAQISSPLLKPEYKNYSYQVYFYDDKIASNTLVKCSKADSIKLSNPTQYGKFGICFLAEENGKKERYLVHFAKTNDFKDSIYFTKTNAMPYSILQQNYITATNKITDVIAKNGAYQIYETRMDSLDNFDKKHIPDTLQTLSNTSLSERSTETSTPNVYYLSEFVNDIDSLDTSSKNENNIGVSSTIKKFKSKPYTPIFNADFVQTSLDNSLTFSQYQRTSFNGNSFNNPSMAGMLKLSLMDIMEDYKITAGLRIPTSLSGLSYYTKFANYKHRLDWEITYFKNSTKALYDQSKSGSLYYSPYVPETGIQVSNIVETELSYPFSLTTAIKLHIGVRQDKLKWKAQDEFSTQFPTINEYWNFNRLEYIIDNTTQPIFNISKGTKIKIYTDAYLQLNKEKTNFFDLGYDFRNYLGIYKNIIVASRLAGAFSGGKSRMLYYLGGTDNEIYPQFNNGVAVDNIENYSYQTTATNLRGYQQNSRNGSSFAVINEEIRLPVANTFIHKNIKSSVIKNLQLVAFTDIGAAWRGILPDADNIGITKTSSNANVHLIIQNNENATAMGYGLGMRTNILGYFIRIDRAWNIEKNKPLWHISMTQDF